MYSARSLSRPERRGITLSWRDVSRGALGKGRARRSRLVTIGTVFLAALALAACSSSGGTSSSGGSPANSSGSSPIVIGLFNGEAGALAQTGVLDIKTAEAVFNQVNAAGGIDGHKIQVVVQNETGNASDAISAMRTFHQDGIHVVIGFTLSSDCEAAAPYMDQYNIVTFGFCEDYKMVGPNRLAKDFYAALFTVEANGQFEGSLMAKEYPKVTHVDVIAGDYAYAHEWVAAVMNGMHESGSKAQLQVTEFPPLTATTYASDIADVEQSASPVTTGLLFEPLAVTTFLQQASSAGLPSKVAFMAAGGSYVAGARALPAGTAPPVWETGGYGVPQIWSQPNRPVGNPSLNTAFQNLSLQATKTYGTENTNVAYVSAKVLVTALHADHGSVDPQTLMQAVNNVSIPVPTGMATVDPTNHLIGQNLVGYQTVGQAGQPDNLKLLKAFLLVNPGLTFRGPSAIQQIYPLS
jgi:ABC-type branched-subunit amino acid transport system substrate-binding protein